MREWTPEIVRRLGPLKLSPTREAEIAEELAQHLDDRYQELLAAGHPADSAFRAALDELKGEDLLARSLRPVERDLYREPIAPGKDSSSFFSSVFQDIRYTFRMLGKFPGFTAVAILTLALGMAVNTTLFSIVNGLILRPLPVPHPEQITVLALTQPGLPTGSGFSHAVYEDLRVQDRSFSDLFAYTVTLGSMTATTPSSLASPTTIFPLSGSSLLSAV